MDISSPTIIRINNRNYRCLHETNFKQRSKTPVKQVKYDEYDDEEDTNLEDFPVGGEVTNLEENLVVEDDSYDLNEDDIDDDKVKLDQLFKSRGIRVERIQGDQFLIKYHVPNCLRGYLIGKNCSNIKEIISKTKTQIDFPQQHRQDDPFIIVGNSDSSVSKACLIMDQLIQSKRRAGSLTHFLSFKCSNEEIQSNYEKFKEIVKSKYLSQDFPDEVFIGKGKLHLTICVLALLDNYERNKMINFMNKSLRKLINEVVKENGLEGQKKYQFKIKNLDIMNDDPSSVRILFGHVDDSNQFVQKLADRINAAANELGYTSELRTKVKLHVTLMNTRYTAKKGKQYQTFDAREILKEFKNFYLGKVDLTEVHLLISGTLDENGGYKSTHKINVF